MREIKALVLTGYGLNCDYETDYSLLLAGAQPFRVHINTLIDAAHGGNGPALRDFHILVFGGGFSWADDHGAGVVMAAKMRRHLGQELQRFIDEGRVVIGICNGFQCLVNLGLLPGFEGSYDQRRVALTYNDTGNFIDTWVNLRVETDSPCVFTRGMETIELPVRHGEGKFYARPEDLATLRQNRQVVMRYADPEGRPARGRWPLNPNGSLEDIAGICDPTGRIFGLMPHPEAFNRRSNHPDWTRERAIRERKGETLDPHGKGDGILIFENAVAYVRETLA